MPITIINFLDSVRSRRKEKENAYTRDGKSLLDRVRTRQSLTLKCWKHDHLQGREKDIEKLLRHAFITLSEHKKRRTSICLNNLLERIDADFLYSKEDGRTKILQFAGASADYEIFQTRSHIYIRNTLSVFSFTLAIYFLWGTNMVIKGQTKAFLAKLATQKIAFLKVKIETN